MVIFALINLVTIFILQLPISLYPIWF